MNTPTQSTCWYTGFDYYHAKCRSRLPIATDGKKEWANCPKCEVTIDIETKITAFETKPITK